MLGVTFISYLEIVDILFILKMFWPFRPQFGLKIRGAGPPGPSPGSATAFHLHWASSLLSESLEQDNIVMIIISHKLNFRTFFLQNLRKSKRNKNLGVRNSPTTDL